MSAGEKYKEGTKVDSPCAHCYEQNVYIQKEGRKLAKVCRSCGTNNGYC